MDSNSNENAEDTASKCTNKSRSRSVLFLLLLLLTLQALGLKIMYLPLNRLIENRFCLDYFRNHDPSIIPPDGLIPEKFCKKDAIQQQLAVLFGTIESVHLVIDLAVAIPFGILSDRGHRRLVLVLNFLGFILMYGWIFGVGYLSTSISPKLMLLGPTLSIVGGGECVFMSTLSATVADLASNDIERTSIFAYISSITYVIHLVSPSLAAVTMSKSLWLPFVIGLFLLSLGIPIVALLSGLPNESKFSSDRTSEQEPLLSSESDPYDGIENTTEKTGIFSQLYERSQVLLRQLSGRRNFQLLLSIFFVAAFASSNSPLFPQYISKRYNWTFANAGYLLSIKAAVNITLLALIVPTAVKLLSSRFDFESGRINKLGSQIMLSISVVGVILIAVSPDVPYLIFAFFVYALGSALPVFTLSLVRDPAVANHDGQSAMDYSLTMIAKYAGNMIGLPLMTALWTYGIGLGGAALGLPYFASGILYATGIGLATALRVNG